jgi:hypothetical protein
VLQHDAFGAVATSVAFVVITRGSEARRDRLVQGINAMFYDVSLSSGGVQARLQLVSDSP